MNVTMLNQFLDRATVAEKRAEEALSANRPTDDPMELQIHYQNAMSLIIGDYQRALASLAEALAAYNPVWSMHLTQVHAQILQLPALLEQLSLSWSADIADNEDQQIDKDNNNND